MIESTATFEQLTSKWLSSQTTSSPSFLKGAKETPALLWFCSSEVLLRLGKDLPSSWDTISVKLATRQLFYQLSINDVEISE